MPTEVVQNKYLLFVIILSVCIAVGFLFYYVFHKDADLPNSDLALEMKAHRPFLMSYKLLKIDVNNKRVFNLAVRIDQKLLNEDLIYLSEKIKSDINVVSDRGTIGFYLPEMLVDNGSWAVVDFNPATNVRIIGLSISDENKIKASLQAIDGGQGIWIDNNSEGDLMHRI